MEKKSKLVLAGGIAALMGLGLVAGAAQADSGGHCGPGWRKHGPGMHQMGRKLLERYDANKDGKISQEEIDKNRTDWQARFDTDKDGTLSLKEFEALWVEAQREEMVREFQRFDRDGDAKVTLEEYKGPMIEFVERFDRNGDGALSKDDRPKHGKRWRRGQGDGPGPGGQGLGPDESNTEPPDQQ